ncbi:hypothetical protein L226DRAFT_493710 [Lentinus tigrinus ALCF2SS1-7]|uniref:MYND-type domain-containing protein n=1 Tax=Lentinus tigrinus ALCF2SS1-6 TaxID=1328759 RepID=A0A5C2RVN3_9APHY|nr:hypothetical protein L227DRAFT_555668 [Lentinus tigrinus ALCF2SS1-6]RPD69963.1 hypothetical protein L226DRAFT_493710 [Lentinus tigrinus ALCF2SS1-7]
MYASASKVKRLSRKCNNCFVDGNQKKLFACSGCRSQQYCSKECQKADWKKHKPMCQNNMMVESALKAHEGTLEGMMDRLTLVDGVSVYELDKRLEKWVQWHKQNLLVATIKALRLSEDASRARTHILCIKLEPRGQAEHQGAPGKYFRVEDAEVVEVEECMRRDRPWPESIAQVRQMDEDSGRNGRGYVAAAMIECPPLYVQTVPFGSITERSGRLLVLDGMWKEDLVRNVEEGQRVKLFQGPSHGGNY